MKMADNKDNIGVFRDLAKTVVDLEKLFQGNQANPIVKAYFAEIIRNMNFTIKFPMPPVSPKKSVLTKVKSDFLNFITTGNLQHIQCHQRCPVLSNATRL